ncbi:hypothetical protein Acsp04_60830 [Actinomadura sp. NBRC 104425]|uniref:hypothetical protein n=1 Tax=Actinomadura sp. NBRC 104425 TaxID=3032204 RepID=UPI0024A088FA|nr:hypothetical protein [Actinomadura sp. NBRC 104425]GLZ15848.1 hypothetical protein Acsp04_60830 [Actinomadura sp. NBRC 104425]
MTTMQIPAPDPDDIEQGIAALERHLAEAADSATPTLQLLPSGDLPVAGRVPDGETKRVKRLRAEVAEAHRLAELYQDDTPLTLESERVRRRRRRVYEAHRLHELSRDPRALAWQAARVRRIAIGASMTALALALGWSSAGVQVFAADGAPAWSAQWLFAWTVEPFLSLALLSIVGVRAFLGAHGQPVESRTLNWLEGLFLALTVTMNAYPHLPGVASPFSFERLMVHLIGPIVAVAIVTGLPVLLDALSRLDIATEPERATGLTGLTYRQNAPTYRSGNRAEVDALVLRARQLIDAGELPPEPSANAIRARFRCGMDTARAVRDAIREGGE